MILLTSGLTVISYIDLIWYCRYVCWQWCV